MKATEIRNILGIYDNDVLNAAAECERKEELAGNIAAAIVTGHGFNRTLYDGHVFSFQKISDILAGFGFEYDHADEESESHIFLNKGNGDIIEVYPVVWYPRQGNLMFQNFHLS